ncbi:MAG: membrane protein insertase YidC [Fimbriimonadaceae bacterium]|nr:membrane protein insertase YidC [Fimbriimonadaceae bacterium]
MSKPAPQRNQFMNILLLGTMVFLGIQLIMGPQQANQDTRTSTEIWAKMVEMNRDLKDVSIQQELRKYENKYNAEAKTKGIKHDEKDRQILRAYLLVADTMHKSGLYRHELFKNGRVAEDYGYRKLDKAYTFLKPKFEAYIRTPLWATTSVTVTPTDLVPGTEHTAKEVYDTIVTDLSPLAKAEPVFGFIPGYQLIEVLVNLTGAVPGFSYWFAALLLALVVRAIIWPLAQKQIMFGRQMSKLQPLIKEIQAKHTDKKTKQIKDPAAYQAESMGLYKEYGINPAAGCLPALIQMPFFLAVYQSMHHYKFEFVKGTFLWVNPASDRFLGIPLAPNLGERDYILVVFYMISMIASTLLMPVTDPNNAKQQRMIGVGMAVLFSVFMFFYTLPSAFVLYWIFTNVLSTAQSLLSYRLPVPELKKIQTVPGGKVVDTTSSKNGHTNGKSNGKTNGEISTDFFGKTDESKMKKQRKRKK